MTEGRAPSGWQCWRPVWVCQGCWPASLEGSGGGRKGRKQNPTDVSLQCSLLRLKLFTFNITLTCFCLCFRYINPFWLVLATNLAAALYAYLFVRESVLPDPGAKLLTTRHYKAVWQLYSTGGSSSEAGGRFHRSKLWLYTLCFFLVVTVHFGSRELYVLYELSSPLCWGPALIGYGSAAQHLAYLTSLLGLKLMQLCLEDSWVAIVGLASNVIGLVVFSVADTTQLMFTGERLWNGLIPSLQTCKLLLAKGRIRSHIISQMLSEFSSARDRLTS